MRAIALLLLLVTGCAAMTSSNAPGMRPPLPPIPCAAPRARPSAAGVLAFAGGVIALVGVVAVVTADGPNEPDADIDEAFRTLGGLGLLGIGGLGLLAAAASHGHSSRPAQVCP